MTGRCWAIVLFTVKKIRPYITEKDAAALPIAGEPDADLRDTELVPFTYPGGIESFLDNEVRTYAPDVYVDEKKTQIGYEINFAKYFYKPAMLPQMHEILQQLQLLEGETDGLMSEIVGGFPDAH